MKEVLQRCTFQVGDDLFHDGVVPVVGLCEQHWFGAVGEDRVTTVNTEHFVLTLWDGLRVEPFHPSDDQPGGDPCQTGIIRQSAHAEQ